MSDLFRYNYIDYHINKINELIYKYFINTKIYIYMNYLLNYNYN